MFASVVKMADTDRRFNKSVNKLTLLGYQLTPQQNALFNHLLSSLSSFLLYIFLFACDIAVAYHHFLNEDPIWANLTIFFMFAPSLACYIVTVSNWDLWPLKFGYGKENIKWVLIKTTEHLFFPIWSVWRFAEKIFWSIEGTRSESDEDVSYCLAKATAPRSVELYFFFQGFLQSLPQILLQLHVLMTSNNLDLHSQTVEAQSASIILNLSKVAVTATFYQRFKTQQVAGKQYPWFKSYKIDYDPTIDHTDGNSTVFLRSTTNREVGTDSEIVLQRRSSDFYLEPSTSTTDPHSPEVFSRETSVIDGPKPAIFRNEPDFNIRRYINIRGMIDDDIAGKLVAFCWWFCFLLARILALSTFAYFYGTQVLWLIGSHFLIVEAFLIYDAKSDETKRAKAVFFVFIGLIYLFCIIEFKIKFKKAKFIYYGFFTLVYVENFCMCLTWWFSDMAMFENDFWFRYVFLLVIGCSIISLGTMLFYLNVNKPPKVVVGTRVIDKKY